ARDVYCARALEVVQFESREINFRHISCSSGIIDQSVQATPTTARRLHERVALFVHFNARSDDASVGTMSRAKFARALSSHLIPCIIYHDVESLAREAHC